jgi:hypothetical protein
MIIGMGMLAAVAGFATTQPASAEDFYVGAGRDGFAVGVDSDRRDRFSERRVVRDRDFGERRRIVVRDRDFARGDCRTTIIRRDGYTKKIRRCD